MGIEDPCPISEAWSVDADTLVRRLVAGQHEGLSFIRSKELDVVADTDSSTLRDIWDHAILRGALPQRRGDVRQGIVRFADMFCGCGGLSLGVRAAIESVGLTAQAVASVDSNRHALEVFERNFKPSLVLARNLWEMADFQVTGRADSARFIGKPLCVDPKMASLSGTVDLLLGGPPCQGYSNSNNHTRRDDPRNVLYWVMPALAIALDVKAVVIENVPEIVHDKRLIVQTAANLLQTNGYEVTQGVVHALDVGVPQRRRRHFLVAAKKPLAGLADVIQKLKAEHRSIKWAIHDLEGVEPDTPLDSPATLSPENQRRIQHLFEHELYDMPNTHRPLSHRDGHTYPSVYGRLRWEEPAGTITTGFMTPGRGRYIHPSAPRTLTAHEAARLQGFPDSFQFKLADGSIAPKTWLVQMIGEAVPPPMAFAVGLAAVSAL